MVRVLRPLRSGREKQRQCVAHREKDFSGSDEESGVIVSRTLDPNVDVVLGLFGVPVVFVSFGEGVCHK